MDPKNYILEACFYYAKSANPKRKALVFRRFASAAAAIQFAVEELTPKLLGGCTLEVNDAHYFGREIECSMTTTPFPCGAIE